jgi:hypothetical protein
MTRAKRLLFAGFTGFAASLLTGCLDKDARADAGDDAAADAGDDAGAEASGEGGAPPDDPCARCEDQWAFSTSLSACCAGAVCGLDARGLAALLPAQASPSGCFARDAPGVRSDYCRAVFERIDGTSDARYTLGASGGTLGLSACCSALGECGLSFTRVDLTLAAQTDSADLGFGCVGLGALEAMLGDALYPLGKSRLDLPTTCNPETGERALRR